MPRRLLHHRREPAARERVVPLDLAVEWAPNDPEAVLIAHDHGATVLALEPHHHDHDRRRVVFRWSGSRLSLASPPNDEAIAGHRLYSKGLSSVLWAGDVVDSELIRALEEQGRVHPAHDPARFASLRHHIVLTKESVVEVVAEAIIVERIDVPTTLDAATRSLAGLRTRE